MKTLLGIDLFKFIAAILIVYMHTYNSDWGMAGEWIKQVLSTACVPFFFLVSGFLFRKGIDGSANKGGIDGERVWFRRYLSRLIIMYLAWSLITLPVALMIVNRGHPEYGITLKILYHFRLFFLTGSIGVYWYLLALILCATIIRWCYRKKYLSMLFVISSVFFLIGCFYNSPLNNHKPLFELIHVVFGSERNFLNVGLFYMLIGFVFPYMGRCKYTSVTYVSIIALLLSVLLRTLEVRFFGSNFTQSLVAMSFFMLALSLKPTFAESLSLELRHLSIALYLIHFPFILVFDFYLNKGTLLDFPITLTFSVLLFYVVSLSLPRFSTILFGYKRA